MSARTVTTGERKLGWRAFVGACALTKGIAPDWAIAAWSILKASDGRDYDRKVVVASQAMVGARDEPRGSKAKGVQFHDDLEQVCKTRISSVLARYTSGGGAVVELHFHQEEATVTVFRENGEAYDGSREDGARTGFDGTGVTRIIEAASGETFVHRQA